MEDDGSSRKKVEGRERPRGERREKFTEETVSKRASSWGKTELGADERLGWELILLGCFIDL